MLLLVSMLVSMRVCFSYVAFLVIFKHHVRKILKNFKCGIIMYAFTSNLFDVFAQLERKQVLARTSFFTVSFKSTGDGCCVAALMLIRHRKCRHLLKLRILRSIVWKAILLFNRQFLIRNLDTTLSQQCLSACPSDRRASGCFGNFSTDRNNIQSHMHGKLTVLFYRTQFSP